MTLITAKVNLRLWLSLTVSAASIWLVLRQVDLRLVAEHVSRADPLPLVILVVSVPASLWMKAVRWQLFFDDSDSVTRSGLFSAIFIGYMVSVIVPLRAGELVRVFLVADAQGLSRAKVLATVVVEKVLDVLAIALLLVGLAIALPLPTWALRSAQVAGGLVIGSIAGLIALLAMERPLLRVVVLLEGWVPLLRRLRLGPFLQSFSQGLTWMRRPGTLARVGGWTVAIWLIALATVWAGLRGTHVASTLGAALLVLTITNLGMIVPSGPGYVGYYHSLVVLALSAFAVNASQALGAALVLHGLTFGTILVGGVFFLWRGQYGLWRLLQSSQREHVQDREATMLSEAGRGG